MVGTTAETCMLRLDFALTNRADVGRASFGTIESASKLCDSTLSAATLAAIRAPSASVFRRMRPSGSSCGLTSRGAEDFGVESNKALAALGVALSALKDPTGESSAPPRPTGSLCFGGGRSAAASAGSKLIRRDCSGVPDLPSMLSPSLDRSRAARRTAASLSAWATVLKYYFCRIACALAILESLSSLRSARRPSANALDSLPRMPAVVSPSLEYDCEW